MRKAPVHFPCEETQAPEVFIQEGRVIVATLISTKSASMKTLAFFTSFATWLLCLTVLVTSQLNPDSASTPAGSAGCISTEGEEGKILDCSSATDVAQIKNFVEKLTFDKFKMVENAYIDHLPAGVLGKLRVRAIEVVSCPSLTEVDGDFLGASNETVFVIFLGYNALTRVPALKAEGLLALDLFGNPLEKIAREDFQGIGNLQSLILPPVPVEILAFHSLTSLRTLAVPFLATSLDTAFPGSFSFNSLHLQEVFFPGSDFQYLLPGVFEGFIPGSKLVMESYNLTSPSVLFNLLSRGARLEFTSSITCGCQQAWIRLSPFLSQTSISCVTEGGQTLLQDMDESEFTSCYVNSL
ncbi:uncharacterized protein LOC125034747 [Penaeus chinensis]|uniref:uncharacterized protein LOC125034747 n=1 Tax=Penaeus chinensis TaxID=139456 RepID=UPI001FB6A590|nr:uncharacterized protein LOC125034747 [Penaeus chinensis]